MNQWVTIGIFLLVLGILFLAAYFLSGLRGGVPDGRLIAEDLSGIQRNTQVLSAHSIGLTGKPDCIVERNKSYIPIEIKSYNAQESPWLSDEMQLMSYCLLIEECFQSAPPYGELWYRNKRFKIPYNQKRKGEVLKIVSQIKQNRTLNDCPRSHETADKCERCGYGDICSNRL